MRLSAALVKNYVILIQGIIILRLTLFDGNLIHEIVLRARKSSSFPEISDNSGISTEGRSQIQEILEIDAGFDFGSIKIPTPTSNLLPAIQSYNGITSFQHYNKTVPIIHLHIAKTGGTSLDSTLKKLINEKIHGNYTGGNKRLYGVHFDWSLIDRVTEKSTENEKFYVVTHLRNPIDRAISHFYFMRKFKWTTGLKSRSQTMGEYLQDYETMLRSRDAWQDGQAGVSWLTGTHIAQWVVTYLDDEMKGERERLSLNDGYMLKLAAQRLKETFWFGILEDEDRSFELLAHQLGIDGTFFTLEKRNRNAKSQSKTVTVEDRALLEKLMPQDMWLYEYAQRLFEARWKFYKTGKYEEPDLPDLPLENCRSTRYIVRCKEPAIYYHWRLPASTDEDFANQAALLPKLD